MGEISTRNYPQGFHRERRRKYPLRKFPFISPEFPRGNYEEISTGIIPLNYPINPHGYRGRWMAHTLGTKLTQPNKPRSLSKLTSRWRFKFEIKYCRKSPLTWAASWTPISFCYWWYNPSDLGGSKQRLGTFCTNLGIFPPSSLFFIFFL